MRTSQVVFAALVCSALLVSNIAALADEAAAPPAKEFFPQPTEREAQLETALDQPLSIHFSETPIGDVAAWFSSKLEAPVILDHGSLEDAGMGSDAPVTRKVDGVSARAALKLVLDDLDLAAVCKGGVIVITTMDTAESELITRVYPVGDLTPLVPATFPGASNAIGRGATGSPQAKEATPSEKLATTEPEKPATPDDTTAAKPARLTPDYDSLIEVIKSTVKPQTWDEVGGPGSISEMLAAKSIVVSQTREVHDDILELLRALRSAKRAGEPIESK